MHFFGLTAMVDVLQTLVASLEGRVRLPCEVIASMSVVYVFMNDLELGTPIYIARVQSSVSMELKAAPNTNTHAYQALDIPPSPCAHRS